MPKLTAVTSGLLALASISLAAGCNGGGEPEDPEEKVEAVREALESPTGTVDATTLADINALNATVSSTAIFAAATGYASAGGACVAGSSTAGTIDLACATELELEENRLTGSISFEAEISAGLSSAETFMVLTYEDVCHGDKCVDGVIATKTDVDSGGVESTIAVSFDVSEGGKTVHLFWGGDFSLTQSGVTSKIALWDSLDHSFVMESSVTEEGVSFEITGENGSFSCSATQEGGKCEGEATIEF
jgi:hypothetical protein